MGMAMAISMQQTISNLQRLSPADYSAISSLIEKILDEDDTMTINEAISIGEDMCSRYNDAFIELAR